jgi:uncharacterized protein
MNHNELQARCLEFLSRSAPADAAHDISHVRRVVKNTLYLTDIEKVDKNITLPASLLHDCVAVAKDSPFRNQGSRLAADAAIVFLKEIAYPESLLPAIRHAIEAHSYSAGIAVSSPEAAVVQDADRLDSLGAIGIARCLLVGGRLNRPLWDADDPFCDHREPDDSRYTLDHFYAKLFKLPATMQTQAGREEAERRASLMRDYLENLRFELC